MARVVISRALRSAISFVSASTSRNTRAISIRALSSITLKSSVLASSCVIPATRSSSATRFSSIWANSLALRSRVLCLLLRLRSRLSMLSSRLSKVSCRFCCLSSFCDRRCCRFRSSASTSSLRRKLSSFACTISCFRVASASSIISRVWASTDLIFESTKR